MEILILHEQLEQSFSELTQFNLGILVEQISKSPEDYVFILSITEWNQWLELHMKIDKELRAIKSSDERWERLLRFTKENEANLFSIISVVSALPNVGNSFKIGTLTQNVLGDCCAVFFTKPSQEQKTAHEVLKQILKFRAEQQNKPPTS